MRTKPTNVGRIWRQKERVLRTKGKGDSLSDEEAKEKKACYSDQPNWRGRSPFCSLRTIAPWGDSAADYAKHEGI